MKPILFNTEMVRAILEGRKTVTRRVIGTEISNARFLGLEINPNTIVRSKDGSEHERILHGVYASFCNGKLHPKFQLVKAPYCPGDVLYVRETWKMAAANPAGGGFAMQDIYLYKADEPIDTTGMLAEKRWHPSIHMPKEAARIFLRVKDVRVERLREITEEGCKAEGAMPVMLSTDPKDTPDELREWHEVLPARSTFPSLWDSTIKPAERERYGWVANPWVWVIDFERISGEEAAK